MVKIRVPTPVLMNLPEPSITPAKVPEAVAVKLLAPRCTRSVETAPVRPAMVRFPPAAEMLKTLFAPARSMLARVIEPAPDSARVLEASTWNVPV